MVTREELLACSIHNWDPAFASHTFKTVCLPLPAGFAAWLEADGVFLPPNSTAVSTRTVLKES